MDWKRRDARDAAAVISLEDSALTGFGRGDGNVEAVDLRRNRYTARKLLSFMLIAHVDRCGDCAKCVMPQRDERSQMR